MPMRRLQETYKIQTRPEDGLNEVLVEFVPWQNSIFNIVRISETYWTDNFCPECKKKYYSLDNFNKDQQETLKKILLEEWGLHVGYMQSPLCNVRTECFLKDSTRYYGS